MNNRELQAYLRPILRWWWLIILSALLAAASAFVFVRLRPPVYISSGTVMVGTAIQDRNPDTQQLSLTQGLAQTYVKIAQRPSIKESTKQALGMDWLPEYSVRIVPDSQLIEISVTDVDAQRAYAVATELINQLILLSPGGQERQQREVFIQEQLRKLEQGLRETEDEINRKQSDLSSALSARQIRQIEDQIAALNAKQSTLQGTYVGLLANTERGSTNTINVLDPPVVPLQPVNDRWYLLVLVAGIMGAAVAIAGAYLLEFLDDRLVNVEQIQQVTGLTTLGTLPDAKLESADQALIMLKNPHSTDAEAFRVLRTNLLFASVDHKLSSLLITSPTPSEGKSFISSNLAVAFAQTGKRVILVDADLRKPTLHRVFGLVNNVGVTSALVSDTSGNVVIGALQATAIPELQVITSGPLPPNPSELLSSQRMQDLLRQLQAHCDLVVIDSPPVLVVSDTAVLASHADGVLLAFSHDKLRRDIARNTIGALRQVNARILGAVLNRVEGSQHGYYYSYHKSYGNRYYSTHYSAQKQNKTKLTGVQPAPSSAPPVAVNQPRVNTNGAGAEHPAERTQQSEL
ncbi:MAG: polysaccharide biosynthesis tyrosine autokinase [Caldilineaceae bacterium]|jgi:capsular exopolysaccharide synthesis family protein|nr:polysaccharide biosynthesis tyrosine autokinase [Caldilineaceae bacterium]